MKEILTQYKNDNDMIEQTFTLTITEMKHGEWQGRLVDADDCETEFRSILELVKTISKKMESKL